MLQRDDLEIFRTRFGCLSPQKVPENVAQIDTSKIYDGAIEALKTDRSLGLDILVILSRIKSIWATKGWILKKSVYFFDITVRLIGNQKILSIRQLFFSKTRPYMASHFSFASV